jgi:hypothetical protein
METDEAVRAARDTSLKPPALKPRLTSAERTIVETGAAER